MKKQNQQILPRPMTTDSLALSTSDADDDSSEPPSSDLSDWSLSGVDLIVGTDFKPLPTDTSISRWTMAALDGTAGRVALRIVGLTEIIELNQIYRGKSGPTNVLSFPVEWPLAIESLTESVKGSALNFLGDIAVCADVIAQEALEQGKCVEAHWAHMIVHGVLHLRGFDHVTETLAAVMEAEEVRILSVLEFPDPYMLGNEPVSDGPGEAHE